MARRRKILPLHSPSALVHAWASRGRPLSTLGLLCLSCTSGQIGGEVGYAAPAAESFGACNVVGEVAVEPDDPHLAFDLAAVVDALDGFHSVETLAWGTALPQGVTVAPEPGTSSIEFEIVVVPGSTRRFEREGPTNAGPLAGDGLGGATDQDAADACEPLLAFDADLTVTTENGALADTFRVAFIARSPHLVQAAFDVVPSELVGTFEFEQNSGSATPSTVRFDLAWADGRLSGRLSGTTVEGAVASQAEIARFPSDG